jgi:hypothetical protein
VKISICFSNARRAWFLPFSAALLSLAACSQTPVTVTLHSLQASGKLSFVCQADDGSGLKLDECPDYEAQRRRILGLVTQISTNEVAVVDLRGGTVVDLDPSTPGYQFARVGGQPGAIVSTPGGVASFVGVSGLQKNGVFALPTSCMTTPVVIPGKPTPVARDLTTWSACALTSAPGDIQLLFDTTGASCPSEAPAAQGDRACQADLTTEAGPTGRRKLLVALPEEHKLVLLDAQALLDRPAGEFQACSVEATYPLQASLPAMSTAPLLPSDLIPDHPDDNVCKPTLFPPATSTAPTPAGMTISGSDLYVADTSLPVVHVLDVTDPCTPVERAPLLPSSYLDPSRVVTTSRLAVSPLTPTGKQYVYAIDKSDQPAASVMVFDVSAGSTNRGPLIFPGAPRQPFSPPDRLRFSASAVDVSFVLRDFPAADPTTGVGQFGLLCDPNPNLDLTAAAAQYRPNSDFSSGARPPNLRGEFGFVMLTNGQIPIIDIEDFDAPCRRPINISKSTTTDFRGCPPDPPTDLSYLTLGLPNLPGNAPTVTNEVSCNTVEPNRPRAEALSLSNSTVGLRAPTLRSFPQFSNPDPSVSLTAQQQPHMLAVDFATANPDETDPDKKAPAQVNVSGQVYCRPQKTLADGSLEPLPAPCDTALDTLPNDPATAASSVTPNALTLPLVEPRSYVGDESPVLTFEGKVTADRTNGVLSQSNGVWTLTDSDAAFCSAGVEDSQAILTEANELAVPAGDQPAWATAHADYVQITGSFLVEDDAYWSRGRGKTCQNPAFGTAIGRDNCVAEFGDIPTPTALKSTRELTIVSAFGDHLVVDARNGNTVDDVQCCFPTGTAYAVRASHQWYLASPTALNDIGAQASDNRCVHTASCDPRKKFFRSRVFELCDSSADQTAFADDDKCQPKAANIGCMRAFTHEDSTTPTMTATNGPLVPGGEGSQCIFENLTARFVVARGAQPSTRDMQFVWSVTGGFTPLVMSLAPESTAILPQSMAYIPELGYLAVVDGETLGLSLFDLNSLGVVAPSPFY